MALYFRIKDFFTTLTEIEHTKQLLFNNLFRIKQNLGIFIPISYPRSKSAEATHYTEWADCFKCYHLIC